ncbi:Dentin sialophosphoprotein [Lasiodiplodia theobromae]|uniref:Dentin sialophosphoprotein n=1 Tax=Lasiodiplodia theobromae TaxID=45133 RepID=A0A5N5D637_9PEZI|nr:Dentin sialophosphoprotein [Lasiodiplodia theobromae]
MERLKTYFTSPSRRRRDNSQGTLTPTTPSATGQSRDVDTVDEIAPRDTLGNQQQQQEGQQHQQSLRPRFLRKKSKRDKKEDDDRDKYTFPNGIACAVTFLLRTRHKNGGNDNTNSNGNGAASSPSACEASVKELSIKGGVQLQQSTDVTNPTDAQLQPLTLSAADNANNPASFDNNGDNPEGNTSDNVGGSPDDNLGDNLGDNLDGNPNGNSDETLDENPSDNLSDTQDNNQDGNPDDVPSNGDDGDDGSATITLPSHLIRHVSSFRGISPMSWERRGWSTPFSFNVRDFSVASSSPSLSPADPRSIAARLAALKREEEEAGQSQSENRDRREPGSDNADDDYNADLSDWCHFLRALHSHEERSNSSRRSRSRSCSRGRSRHRRCHHCHHHDHHHHHHRRAIAAAATLSGESATLEASGTGERGSRSRNGDGEHYPDEVYYKVEVIWKLACSFNEWLRQGERGRRRMRSGSPEAVRRQLEQGQGQDQDQEPDQEQAQVQEQGEGQQLEQPEQHEQQEHQEQPEHQEHEEQHGQQEQHEQQKHQNEPSAEDLHEHRDQQDEQDSEPGEWAGMGMEQAMARPASVISEHFHSGGETAARKGGTRRRGSRTDGWTSPFASLIGKRRVTHDDAHQDVAKYRRRQDSSPQATPPKPAKKGRKDGQSKEATREGPAVDREDGRISQLDAITEERSDDSSTGTMRQRNTDGVEIDSSDDEHPSAAIHLDEDSRKQKVEDIALTSETKHVKKEENDTHTERDSADSPGVSQPPLSVQDMVRQQLHQPTPSSSSAESASLKADEVAQSCDSDQQEEVTVDARPLTYQPGVSSDDNISVGKQRQVSDETMEMKSQKISECGTNYYSTAGAKHSIYCKDSSTYCTNDSSYWTHGSTTHNTNSPDSSYTNGSKCRRNDSNYCCTADSSFCAKNSNYDASRPNYRADYHYSDCRADGERGVRGTGRKWERAEVEGTEDVDSRGDGFGEGPAISPW